MWIEDREISLPKKCGIIKIFSKKKHILQGKIFMKLVRIEPGTLEREYLAFINLMLNQIGHSIEKKNFFNVWQIPNLNKIMKKTF